MPFVLDASMTVSWRFADESTLHGRSVLNEILESNAEVPAHWPFEVANVLAVGEKRQRITEVAANEFLRTLAGLDIRIDASSPRVGGVALLPLVRRYGLSAYDAAYLELAIRKGLPLASLDREPIQAGNQEGLAVAGNPS
jgi:predicted nucleic acid-binding protein